MDDSKFDVIVIGTGPGGEGAAMQAAKGGKRVAVIERYSRIGGGCTHWGYYSRSRCVSPSTPSWKRSTTRSFVTSVWRVSYVRTAASSSRSIISKQESMRLNFYDRNMVPVIHGQARFVDAHTIEVE